MRRLVVLAAVAALGGAALAGCGRASTASPSATAKPGPLKDIVYLNPLPSSPLWDHYGQCVAQEAKARGVAEREVRVGTSNVDFQGYYNATSQAVADHTQGIIAWDTEIAASYDPLWRRLHADGGVVALFGNANIQNAADVELGDVQASTARADIDAVASAGPGQHVALIQSSAQAVAQDHLPAFRAEAAARGVTIDEIAYDGNLFSDDESIASGLLRRHSDLTALVVFDGSPGTVTAIRENNDIGKVYAYMSDEYHTAMLDYITDGAVRLIKVSDECATARAAVDDLIALRAGRRVPHADDVPDHYVTTTAYRQLLASGQL